LHSCPSKVKSLILKLTKNDFPFKSSSNIGL
jgi:hypothetical protein